MKKKLFPFLILLTAIAVSFSAAFYSVYGLSKLFAGASLAVIFMASSLELAKLVIASTLHRYWNSLYLWLKTYLVIALLVLICITSAGIYGFLSSAYQVTADQSNITDKRIEILTSKKKRFEESRDQYLTEKQQLVSAVTSLRSNLATNNQRQTVDRRTGQVLTTIISSNKQSIASEVAATSSKIDQVDKRINTLSDSITTLDIAIIELNANSQSTAELGPLRYLSNLTGASMEVIINYLLLLIIFVFDPLAIALVITASSTFKLLASDETVEFNTPIQEKQENSLTFSQDIDPEDEIENLPNVEPSQEVIELKEDDDDQSLSDLQKKVKEILPWAFAKREVKAAKPPDLLFKEKRNSPHQQ